MAYHVSPNGPSLCHAKLGRCPYGANDENHFATVNQASEFYEKRMAEAFGGFETIKRSGKQTRKERSYAMLDRFVAVGYAVKSSAVVSAAATAVKAVRAAPAEVALRVSSLKAKAWRGISRANIVAHKVSSEAAKSINTTRARYSEYTAKISEENKALVATYQKNQELAVARHDAIKTIEAKYAGKVHSSNAGKIRLGDRLEDGTIVSKMKLVNGSTVLTTRNDSTGQFGKNVILGARDSINIIHPRRQLLRQAGAAYKTAREATVQRALMTTGAVKMQTRGYFDAAKGRVTYAAALQRKSFEALAGIDRDLIQNRSAVASNPVSEIQHIHSFRSVA